MIDEGDLVTTLLEDLQADITSGSCVLLVGTGVSVALSGERKASWAGFLESGAEYARLLGQIDDEDAERLVAKLGLAGSGDDYLEVASSVVEALGGSESGNFSQWLRRDIGYLEVRDDRIAKAIEQLHLPIVTTNYDGLLEKALGRDHVTWMQGSQFQLVLGKRTRDIAHLHGYWMEPRSIVLTKEQYELLLADRELELLRQAMASINSLVYVGFGDGLTDPHFEKMRAWIREAFPSQQLQHYRLCRSNEAEVLSEEFREDRIRPIIYGDSHNDLAPFLEALAPASSGSEKIEPGYAGLQIIEELVRESAVLGLHVRGAEEAPFTDLLIPPVLLPMPPDQFVAATRDRDELATKPQRCDLDEEINTSRVILAGDEHVGVTSALNWMTGKICIGKPRLIPIRVDFLEVGAGHGPLRRQVIKQLRSVGRFYREADALPALVLILDNVHLGSQARLERVAHELGEPQYVQVLIGCRSGTETLLAEALGNAGLDFKVRYVGRLARADVRALARLVDPSRADNLSNKAIEVVEAHRLPSTPFTFSMIVSAILRGESLMAATSPTALLDAYLDLLLGKGATDEDSRYGLDAFNRSFILAKLAEHFVHRKAGALPLTEVVSALTESLDELDWPENAVDVLKDLESRHVLTIRSGEVSFSQNSYLHLFAAKRASDSFAFRAKLISDPLYYSPIIAHHAALKRNDVELLEEVLGLVEPYVHGSIERSRLFKPVLDTTPRQLLTHEELRKRIDVEAKSAAEDDDEDELAPVGAGSDEDLRPFPLQPVDELPLIPRLLTTLGLVSNVMRDTEIIPNQDARREALTQVLSGWAVLADAIESDESYDSHSREAALELAAEIGIPERMIERFIDEVRTIIPLSVSFAGISTTLSSRKLFRTTMRCLEREDFAKDPALALLGSYLLFDVQTPGWTDRLELLLERHENVLGVRSIFRRVMFYAFLRQPKDSSDEKNVRDFLVEQMLREQGLKGADAGHRRGVMIESLNQAKLKYRRNPDELVRQGPALLGGLNGGD